MIKIRKFKIGDTKKTANLISSVFGKFNSREGSKEAVQKYINFYDPKKGNEINIGHIGGETARGIVEVLNKYSEELKGWKV